ncbi:MULTISPECIES: DUF1542 domain-containing protein, partial [unclassified Streptococcus]|uniref:DUF1542 domain-containing protein n=1 Tax=unclassified Streptococcus TaxID=2608887 RepID=UPI0010727F9F
AKKAELDARTDLTDEEKTVAKAQVDAEAAKAKSAIDQATTNAGVDSAKNTGVDTIKAINPDATAKDTVKKTIGDLAAAKKSEIDARPDLTDEEKAAAKAQVDAEAEKAKAAVDAATTDEAVASALEAGVDTIKAINPDAVAKPEAKKAIDEAANAKKAELDARTDLTDEEKTVAKAQVDAEAAKAKAAIDAATTNAGVEGAKTLGIEAINAINPSAQAGDAKATHQAKASDTALQVKKDTKGQLPNTGDEANLAVTMTGLTLFGLLAGARKRRRKED